jgi:aminopeptidase N
MLRGLLLDPEDPDEGRFAGLMRSFYAAHRGGVMSTGQFRAAAEQAAGRDLGWFFDQWVDHAAIPTYTFSYRVDQASDGRYVVHGRVKQSHVPPSFRMDVPVRIELPAGAPERLRVQVSGPVTEFDLPPVSGKPTRVVFNDLGAVLCEVIEAPWE